MDTTTLALIIGVGLLAVLAGGVATALAVKLTRRGTPIAGVSLRAAGPFGIALPPRAPDGPVEIWIRYAVAFPYERPLGQEASKAFCLVVDLVADGRSMVLGHGGRHPDGAEDFDGIVSHMTSFSSEGSGGMSRYRASMMVKRLPSCPRTLHGEIRVGGGTVLHEAHLTVESMGGS